MGCGILVSYHLFKQDTTWIFTKMDGRVNKGLPVFSREKSCIQKLPVLPRAIKYSIFYNKIQGLPYILYSGVLYDGIIWTSRPVMMIRFTGSVLRRGLTGMGHRKALLKNKEGLDHQKRTLVIES
jgi:hypothetical protein